MYVLTDTYKINHDAIEKGKNCPSDREKLLKFKAEGRDSVKILRSRGMR